MANVQLNNRTKSIQDIFFSKENISALNKIILDSNSLTHTDKDNKKKIVDMLIKNMKVVYKSLNVNKINDSNINSIRAQFNKLSIDETSNELSRGMRTINNKDINSSQLKFERDFKSKPNNGNKIMDRPIASTSKTAFLYPPGCQNANQNNLDPKLDKLFKPIVDNLDENYSFNQYQHGKGSEDMGERMDSLVAERDNESRLPKRPPTPDFLKPMRTQTTKETLSNVILKQNDSNNNLKQPQKQPHKQIIRKGGKPNFSQDIPQDELDMGFLSANNDDNELYSISNIDKPSDIIEIEEDHRPFEQRLQSLQNDRGNINIPRATKKINFEDPSLMNNEHQDDLNEIPEYQPKTIEEIKNKKNVMKTQHNIQYDTDTSETPPIRVNIQKNNEQTINKNINMKKIQETLKKLGATNSAEMLQLKKENEQLKQLLENNNSNKITTLKKDIAIEFAKLEEKKDFIETKENELTYLLKKHNYLYGTKHIQLDISPTTSSSNYTFEFGPVFNITGIKLMSYSIPQPRYNIEENKNNSFKIKINNEIKEVKLNNGKYKIENIIKLLNEKMPELHFELNYEEKIEITSEDFFDIIPTIFSKEVLGFTINNTNNNKYIGDKTWDLRIEDKIYLFIDNLQDTAPFAVLYLGNPATAQFKFEEEIKLNKLDLSFRDTKGRPFNFFGLNYSLSVQLEIHEQITL
jgi:hypothetical protein